MLDKKIVDLLNQQINRELTSEYLYLHIANYYDEVSLDGFKNWFQVQVKEERDHADMMMKYLQDNNEKVVLEAIAKPKGNFTTFIEPLEAAYKHEQFISASIHNIYAEAYELKDFRTMQFLDWFVKEQLEEEKSADDLISKFKLFGGDAKSLYDLDQELLGRAYQAPTLNE